MSAGLAAGAAVALTVVGARRGDGRAVLVGPAFSAMAALLAIHGLTTPGLLAGQNGVVVFSGAATLPVGGAVLALSAVPEIRQPWNISRLLWLQGVLLALIAGVGAAGILAPAIVPSALERVLSREAAPQPSVEPVAHSTQSASILRHEHALSA